MGWRGPIGWKNSDSIQSGFTERSSPMSRPHCIIVLVLVLVASVSVPAFAAQRPLVAGRNAGVSAGHPLTTAAAVEILQRGGNAFDAGVAALLRRRCRRAGPLRPRSNAGVAGFSSAVSSSRTSTASVAKGSCSFTRGGRERSLRSSARVGQRRRRPSSGTLSAARRSRGRGSTPPSCRERSMRRSPCSRGGGR